MTGCNNMNNAIVALEKMFEVLKQPQIIYDKKNKTIQKKYMVENPDELIIKNVHSLKIAMINSNFNINFDMDRSKLYYIMKHDKLNCSFDPNLHAAVIFKHKIDDKEISIFIFEKGSIVITGATNCLHIKKSYDFINIYLLTNWREIIKKDKIVSSIVNEVRKNTIN